MDRLSRGREGTGTAIQPTTGHRIRAIPHGVDSSKFSPDAASDASGDDEADASMSNDGRVLAAGRPTMPTRRAWTRPSKLLHCSLKTPCLLSPGSSTLERLRGRQRTWVVGDRVRVWPHTSEIIDYYAAADILVAPSREDAFCHAPSRGHGMRGTYRREQAGRCLRAA